MTKSLFPLILLAAALLAGCAGGTRVVLLPQPDGKPSAVVVTNKAGKDAATLSTPYQRAAVARADSQPKVDAADPAQVRKNNAPLFDLRPQPPQNYTLYFAAGGTTLTEESQRVVKDMLADAAKRPGADIVVTGHTDTTGSLSQNDVLSRNRAEEIRQMLVRDGFDASHIEAVGRGLRELAVPTAANVDEPRNRRVTVQVR